MPRPFLRCERIDRQGQAPLRHQAWCQRGDPSGPPVGCAGLCCSSAGKAQLPCQEPEVKCLIGCLAVLLLRLNCLLGLGYPFDCASRRFVRLFSTTIAI